MKRNIAAATAFCLASFGFAGSVQAATCHLMSEDKEITFTLTRGNPDTVLDQACVRGGIGVEKLAGAYKVSDTRGWRRAESRRVASAGRASPRAFAGGGARSVGAGSKSKAVQNGAIRSSGNNPDEELVLVLKAEDEVLSQVPVPAAGGLLITALAGMFVLRRRRKS